MSKPARPDELSSPQDATAVEKLPILDVPTKVEEKLKGIELVLFCHGLGDCHLLGFPAANGKGRVWMMIDCGLHGSTKGGRERMDALFAAIRKHLAKESMLSGTGDLAVVALTHEHWDHNSGFHPRQTLFDANGPKVGEVWMAWTEDTKDPLGRELDKYKGAAVKVIANSHARIENVAALLPIRNAWEAMLGFYGAISYESAAAAVKSSDDMGDGGGAIDELAVKVESFALKGEVSRIARDAAAQLAHPKLPRFLEPGDVLAIPGVDGVRCYVLAPPRDRKMLGLLDSKADTFGAAGTGNATLDALANALAVQGGMSLDEDETGPFDASEGLPLTKAIGEVSFLRDHYLDQPQRTIDHDWLMGASDLALQLDAKTNNTSLVLAFEIIETGHVLLFAADAQVGNWKSWMTVKFPATSDRSATTGARLLERAVFYKVGHHGSRNATLREGLEKMTALEVAFNPTDEKMAQKVGWNDIPATALNAELYRRTKGRLIQSDQRWIADRSRPIPIAEGGALVSIRRGEGPSLKLHIL
ncbi:hypothetical protein WBP07_11500 [Novosphingobium sp. BL-8A]|uniref:hypothetical protein n=1 Tax=Novosphingobium sp. BL-8A TaxID=3127639 RepID=UPI0037582423